MYSNIISKWYWNIYFDIGMFAFCGDKLLQGATKDYLVLGYHDTAIYQKDLHYREKMVILISLVIVKKRN